MVLSEQILRDDVTMGEIEWRAGGSVIGESFCFCGWYRAVQMVILGQGAERCLQTITGSISDIPADYNFLSHAAKYGNTVV
jgi:hypothetical protein